MPEIAVAGGTETILIVEDDPRLRELSRLLLTQAGYTVLAAEDGAVALALAEDGRAIDLLVTDVVMPGMNGPELAERLRASRPGIRVVYVSGYHDRSLAGRAIRPDDAVVVKPFREDELRREVRRALEQP